MRDPVTGDGRRRCERSVVIGSTPLRGGRKSHAGGLATASGILYQILGGVRRTVSLTLEDASVRDDEVASARLVIEPARGGDLAEERPDGRVVEQWKSRRMGKPWSAREVVDHVLPDLDVAVDLRRAVPATHRFRAEGRVTIGVASRRFSTASATEPAVASSSTPPGRSCSESAAPG